MPCLFDKLHFNPLNQNFILGAEIDNILDLSLPFPSDPVDSHLPQQEKAVTTVEQ